MFNFHKLFLGLFLLFVAGCNRSAEITVDPSVTYQTMIGWESAILSTVKDYRNYDLPAFDKLLDTIVDDIGMTRLQLGVYSGMENPQDHFDDYLSGRISEHDWAVHHMYDSRNDNDDPKVMNPVGFHFGALDWQLDNLVLRIRQKVEARGEKLYTYLNYVDYEKSPFEHWRNPDEYAEFMLAVFDHMQKKYGIVPDGINVINEPDLKNEWPKSQIGKVIVATGDRLAAAGYRPDFIAPATTGMPNAPIYFDAIVAVPGASRYLKEISYHRYGVVQDTSILQQIADRAVKYGIRTGMNEFWKPQNTYRTLHDDLKVGRNSSWQQGTLGGGNGYYTIDPENSSVVIVPKTKLMRQYYKFVRQGAQRIEAETDNSDFDPLAFINSDGKYVVVVRADAGGNLSIRDLPAGTYGIKYSTEAQYDVDLPDFNLAANQILSAAIPEVGVITVYQKSGDNIATKKIAGNPAGR